MISTNIYSQSDDIYLTISSMTDEFEFIGMAIVHTDDVECWKQ